MTTAAAGDRFRAGKRLWSVADDAALRARYPHEPTAALARAFRRTLTAVYARARRLGLEKSQAYQESPAACRLRRGDHVGAAYRFTTGHVPANKGVRRPGFGPGRMKSTQFKKGQVGTRTRPIGSTRLVDGYVYRKVADAPCVPWTANWAPEHRRVWEAVHGPVPAGYALRFQDYDRTNTRLDNLELIPRGELMTRNSVHNLPAPLPQTIQLLGALTRQIRRRRRHAREEQDQRPA